MSEEPVLIVGGGPAGHAAAAAYREADGAAPVVMTVAEPLPPYRRPPLTKELLRGGLDPAELPLAPADWYPLHGVELLLSTTVASIDAGERVALLESGEEIAYRECVLCTGSAPVRPPLPGIGLEGVHEMRTLADATALAAAAPAGARIVVLGSGFIGCEAAASLAARGVEVTMVTPEPCPQHERLGPGVGDRLRSWLEEAGVAVMTRAGAVAVAREGRTLRVDLEGGEAVRCDRVLLGTGARPRLEVAESAGVEIDGGGVPVDPSMRTAVDGVLCAGDPAYALNPAAGRRLRVEHWGEALAQGEVAGLALAGRPARWDAVPGFWSTIGRRTIKQAAWGDGWDDVLIDADARGFTAWYGRGGTLVGVLTHDRDRDYIRGRDLIREGGPYPPE